MAKGKLRTETGWLVVSLVVAALVAGAAPPLRADSVVKLQVNVPGVAWPWQLLRSGYWMDVGNNFQLAVFRPDDAEDYILQEIGLNGLGTLSRGAIGLLSYALPAAVKDVVGVASVATEVPGLVLLEEVEESKLFAAGAPRGVIAVLLYRYIPVLCVACQLNPNLPVPGPALAAAQFTTNKFCGASFTPNEPVVALIQLPYDAVGIVQLISNDTGSMRAVQSGIKILANQPVGVPIPHNITPVGHYRLRLAATDEFGYVHSFPSCGFSIEDLVPGGVTPVPAWVFNPPPTPQPGPCPIPTNYAVAFGDQLVGTPSSPLTCGVLGPGSGCFGIVNPSNHVSIVSTQLTGPNAGDFVITSNSCNGTEAPGASCYVGISFVPRAPGTLTATLGVWADGCLQITWQLTGRGVGGGGGK